VVNNDADSSRLLPVDPSFLEFCQSEATAFTKLDVVAYSLSADGWTEEFYWTNAEVQSFGFAGNASAKFAARLIKPGFDSALPVLAEVIAGKD